MTTTTKPTCLITFDVEAYFQTENAFGLIDRSQWDSLDTRLEPVIDKLLNLLARHDAKITFFTLGWVAEKHPDMIRRMHQQGHEIACHGYRHDRLHRLGSDGFREDLSAAQSILENIIGQPVIGYRAPTFSIDHTTAWAIDVLAELGFEYDSSVQPIRRKAYGVPGAPTEPYQIISPNNAQLIELPPLTWSIGNYRLPVAGGGYFRLFPLRLMLNGLKQTNRRGYPGMCYFHPWEFDPDQPRMNLKGGKRFRHYVNLNKTFPRLNTLLQKHQTTPVRSWLQNQNTKTWPIFKLEQKSPKPTS